MGQPRKHWYPKPLPYRTDCRTRRQHHSLVRIIGVNSPSSAGLAGTSIRFTYVNLRYPQPAAYYVPAGPVRRQTHPHEIQIVGTGKCTKCAKIHSFQILSRCGSSALKHRLKCSCSRYRSIANKFVNIMAPEVSRTTGGRANKDRYRDRLPFLPPWFEFVQFQNSDHHTLPAGIPSHVRPPSSLPAAFLVVR